MKKTLLAAAFALVSVSAWASENETVAPYVEFSVSAGGSTTKATVLMGIPTPIQQVRQKMSSACTFTRDTAGAPMKLEFSLDTSTGMTTTVLPIERTAEGLKAYVTINKQSAQSQDWAVISKDCKLPVGTISSVGFSLVDTFDWGQPTKLKLSDGSVVVVQVNQAGS